MTCEYVKIPNGPMAIVCHRNRRKVRCACGAIASRECDFVIDRTHSAGKITCDKPLCTKCAVSGGANVDYCPDHPAQTGMQGKLAL